MNEGPQTFDELLAVVPGLNYVRSLNGQTIRMLLNRKAKECTWCGAKVPKGRSTWCSETCVQEFRSRCDIQHLAAIVCRDANGICQSCGRDTKKCERIWKSIQHNRKWAWTSDKELYKRRQKEKDDVRLMLGFRRGQWGEVDHVVPVKDGGGMLGIENLRYICGECHYRKTHKKK